jgi:phosphatidyl-myo-inositol dimannoside synthase
MRLLLVTPDYPPSRGGIQVLGARLATGLGFSVSVVTRGAPGQGEPNGAGVRVLRVWPQVSSASLVALNGAAFAAAGSLRPDALLNLHVATAPAAVAAKRTLGIPFVQYFHGMEVAHRPELVRLALRDASASIAVGSRTASAVRTLGHAETVRQIPPGVDLPQGAPESRGDGATVLTVARMDERYKGHDVLVRAIALASEAVPKLRWVVVGDGRLAPHLRSLVAAHGIEDRVELVGSVDVARRDRALAAASLFVLLSREGPDGWEGFGISFMEAAAWGLPVVAGRAGGAIDAVVDGSTGLLVDPEDAEAAAAAIVQLLEDSERASALGAAGRRRAAAFAWPRVARQVAALIRDVVESGA